MKRNSLTHSEKNLGKFIKSNLSKKWEDKNKELSNSDTHCFPFYNELSKTFHNMNDNALNALKKLSLQKKMILKLKGEILKVKSTLESLKEYHASLANDQVCIFKL